MPFLTDRGNSPVEYADVSGEVRTEASREQCPGCEDAHPHTRGRTEDPVEGRPQVSALRRTPGAGRTGGKVQRAGTVAARELSTLGKRSRRCRELAPGRRSADAGEVAGIVDVEGSAAAKQVFPRSHFPSAGATSGRIVGS